MELLRKSEKNKKALDKMATEKDNSDMKMQLKLRQKLNRKMTKKAKKLMRFFKQWYRK